MDEVLDTERTNLHQYGNCQAQLEIYELIFEALLTEAGDPTPKLHQHTSTSLRRFPWVDPAAQIGKHCTEVVENSGCTLWRDPVS